MKTWNRAILYLIRKKGRSILLIILIFIMASLILAGNALRMSAKKEIENIRKNLGSSFTVAADTNNSALYEERTDKPYPYSVFVGATISPELLDNILDTEDIVDYDIDSYELAWTDLQLRPGLYADLTETPTSTEEEILLYRQTTEAVICANGEKNTNFRTGAFFISEGRNIVSEDKFVAVISEYAAEKNRITVGDTITLETNRGIFEPCDDPFERWGVPVELEIIGIFAVNFEQETSYLTPEGHYADNLIFTDQTTGAQLKENRGADQTQEPYGEVTFFVDDPENLENVMTQVKDSVDLTGLLISLDDTAYMASVRPLKQISIFAFILMFSGAFGCIIILCLILTLWIRGRTHEIGILLSIGIRKGKIITQIMIECMIITAISLVLTLGSARVMTNGFFNLAKKMTTPKTSEENYTLEVELGESVPTITKVSSGDPVNLEYNDSGQNMLFLVIVVCLISCGSVLLASVQIMKISPNRLLQSG